jgi:hypothetical protein
MKLSICLKLPQDDLLDDQAWHHVLQAVQGQSPSDLSVLRLLTLYIYILYTYGGPRVLHVSVFGLGSHQKVALVGNTLIAGRTTILGSNTYQR